MCYEQLEIIFYIKQFDVTPKFQIYQASLKKYKVLLINDYFGYCKCVSYYCLAIQLIPKEVYVQ